MANITMSVTKELHSKMQKHPEFKWSEVARQAIEERINDTELLNNLKSIARAEKEHKEGKTLSHAALLKELAIK